MDQPLLEVLPLEKALGCQFSVSERDRPTSRYRKDMLVLHLHEGYRPVSEDTRGVRSTFSVLISSASARSESENFCFRSSTNSS